MSSLNLPQKGRLVMLDQRATFDPPSSSFLLPVVCLTASVTDSKFKVRFSWVLFFFVQQV
jgi:hypothetical protein